MMSKEDIDYVCDCLYEFVCSVVDNEDAVEVKPVAGSSSLVLEVFVTTRDMRFVTGQQGRTAEAIKTLLNAVCKKRKIHAHTLNIIEKQG